MNLLFSKLAQLSSASNVFTSMLSSRNGVLEDVLGLEDTFWSPWPWRSSPWSRGLKSSKTALSSALGQPFFLNCWNFADRLKKNFRRRFLPENAWKKFWRPLIFFFFFEIAWKRFLKTFFFENTCACVLGPWPRVFLFLASRGSVLGRAVLGLGFFCVLGLQPCVLDSTSVIQRTLLLVLA